MSEDFKFQGSRPEDIFEAITVMAKRARKINEERSELYPINSYVDTESEEVLEDDVDFDTFEKATTMAMKEYERGEIEFEYKKVEEPLDLDPEDEK